MQNCVMGIVLCMIMRQCEHLSCEMYLSSCEESFEVVVSFDVIKGLYIGDRDYFDFF